LGTRKELANNRRLQIFCVLGINMSAINFNLVNIKSASVNDSSIVVELEDGRSYSIPLYFYPSLANAPIQDRQIIEIYPLSLSWPTLDVDIGIEGIMLGAKEHPYYAKPQQARAL